jgi:hypothetical protein
MKMKMLGSGGIVVGFSCAAEILGSSFWYRWRRIVRAMIKPR